MSQNKQATSTVNDKVLVDLVQLIISGVELTPKEIVENIDLDTNYDKIKEYIVKQSKVCSARDFDQAIKNRKNYDILGGYPETITSFVSLYTKKNNIKLSYKKMVLSSSVKNKVEEKYKSELKEYEKNFSDKQNPKIIREYKEKIDCTKRVDNINDISRKLRIISKEMELNYNKSDIDDVIQEWILESQSERLGEIYDSISYAKSPSKGDRSFYEWSELATSMFEHNVKYDLSLPAKISILKKFIWQVKRKMRNIDVTNHLMPVLLGPQGTGKSTFLNKLIEPLAELSTNSDFRQITDDRNIDLWDNYIIKTDEMGWASKADIDTIKNLITTKTISRRIMKTNNSVPVEQRATFIGASNKSMNQLVRDETGTRRFCGCLIRSNPDWVRMNSIPANLLWSSVDEEAEDPTLEFMDEIKAYQERSRAETSCELWINSLPKQYSEKPKNGYELFNEFKEWETIHFSKKRMDFDDWQAEMIRLLTTNFNLPFIFTETSYGYEFQFISSRAKNRDINEERKSLDIEKIRIKRNHEFSMKKIELKEIFIDQVNKNYECDNDSDVIDYVQSTEEKITEPTEKSETKDIQQKTIEVVDNKKVVASGSIHDNTLELIKKYAKTNRQ